MAESAANVALKAALQAMTQEPARAEALARGVLQSAPEHGDAKLVLSEALRRQGKIEDARALVAPLAAAAPEWFGAHRQLGVILAELNEPLPASLALRRAAELFPDHPSIWRELGTQLALSGDVAGARAAHARHAHQRMLEPRIAEAGRALGGNDYERAEQILRAHLNEHPNDVTALRLLSEALARGGRSDEAEAALRQALEIAPEFGYARHALGQLLMGQGRVAEARAESSALLLREPGNGGALRLHAAVLNAAGEYEEALAIYQRLLDTDPTQARVWMSCGHLLKTVGRAEEGIAAYRKSIELMPTLGESYWSLANLKTFKFGPSDVARMLELAQRQDLSADDRVGLFYALGKALEDAGDAAGAFQRYSEGAALWRQAYPYEAAQTSRFVDQSLSLFTRAFFAEREGQGDPAPDPIFIVGLPRAGSTLLEQILASHSQVEGTMELLDLQVATQRLVTMQAVLAGRSYLDALADCDGDSLRAMGGAYMRSTRLFRKLGRPFFINKLPNNFLHVGLIKLILPNAKIIDARRHPMACGWSCFKQHFAVGQLFSYDLGDIGVFYRDYVRVMRHWDEVLPGAVHRVVHEELVADPETHIRALLEYCGLPFEAACLTPHQTERAVRTASSEQVREPISAKGLHSWRKFEPYLAPLKAALGPVLEAYPDAPR